MGPRSGKGRGGAWPILAAWAVLCALPVSAAEEGSDEAPVNFEYRTVTTPEGLTFRVPEDMPIENRGGIVAPIPFDEYIYAKFRKLEAKVKRLETRLAESERLLSERAGKDAASAAGGRA